ncbi:hypothetical protein N7520_010451 [Penicillium odoratum]|uniref:uncharacterized protein n=1 Tax=Penicillium odoratum TaxID=1167516 RepID=UPI0025494168|nr:uncharacterized protein N7520_010451 [Penicillium odoratum]KAJ5745269.1 hypothetical protein N7520_010451 [Penicillium odoratum]
MSLTPPNSKRTTLQEDLGRVLKQLNALEVGSLPIEINSAVDCARAAAHDTTQDEAGKVLALTILAAALQKRYQVSTPKNPTDLEEAVDVTRAAVEITIRRSQESSIKDSQVYFINLERALCFRYGTKEEAHIEECVAIVIPLLNLVQQGSKCHAFTLKILSSLYSAGYNRTKNPKYLDDAIDVTNSAISIIPEKHPFVAVMLKVLAKLHDQRFEKTNLLSDLEIFISTLQELSEAHNDTLKKFDVVHELACAFERRHKLTENIEDLEKAIDYGTAAVKLAPKSSLKGHPISARDISVHNLRIHVKDYFRKTGNIPEIDEDFLEGAGIVGMLVNLDSDNKTQQRHKIAKALQKLYEKTNRVFDIEQALRLTLTAMQSIDDSQDEWGAIQDTFKAHFRLWSEHTGKMPDCEITIMAFERNGGTYIPPESTADLGLSVPLMIFSGELPVE